MDSVITFIGAEIHFESLKNLHYKPFVFSRMAAPKNHQINDSASGHTSDSTDTVTT